MKKLVITPRVLGESLGVSVHTVYRHIREGKLDVTSLESVVRWYCGMSYGVGVKDET